MNAFRTEQEEFWAGSFGDEYIERNKEIRLLSSKTALFGTILKNTKNIQTLIEFGANIGLNLLAIKTLVPDIKLAAVEINKKACDELKKIPDLEVFEQSVLDFVPTKRFDLVLTSGLLIHINPDMLPLVYEKIYESSSRYICIIEYYNPTPVEVKYRGHDRKLFKRDFAGEMLDTYKDLQLITYGFVYRRDPMFPLDDPTWFLLEKRAV